MKSGKKKYHHGELPSAILASAGQMILEEGIESLTLRRIGARLGVSRTALYRHFKNKEALLAKLACEGFVALTAAMRGAVERRKSGERRLAEIAAAYVAFAIANPSTFHVMFGRRFQNWVEHTELIHASRGAFALLLQATLDAVSGAAITSADANKIAQAVWSAAHGISVLAMDGRLRGKSLHPTDYCELARLSVDLIEQGLEARFRRSARRRSGVASRPGDA